MLRRQVGDAVTMNDMAKLIKQAKGKVYFDKFRNQVSIFNGKEQGLMEQRQADAITNASRTKTVIMFGTAITIAVALVLSILISGTITKPIRKIVNNIKDIAEGEGDLTARLDVSSRDEIGELSQWFNTFIDKIHDIITQIAANSDTLSSSSVDLSATSTQMATSVEQTSSQATTVAAAAEEMSVNMASVAAAEQAATNVSIVATATEEMTSTIEEVAQNTEKTSSMTTKAVAQASKASDNVNELRDAAQEISKVT